MIFNILLLYPEFFAYLIYFFVKLHYILVKRKLLLLRMLAGNNVYCLY